MVRSAGSDAAGLKTVEEQLQWMLMDTTDDKVQKLPPIVLASPSWFPRAAGWTIPTRPAAGRDPVPGTHPPVGGAPVTPGGGFSLPDICHQAASAIEGFPTAPDPSAVWSPA